MAPLETVADVEPPLPTPTDTVGAAPVPVRLMGCAEVGALSVIVTAPVSTPAETGWNVIDAKRAEVGMASIALSKPDNASHFLNCQVEHIEIAGSLGLGMFDDNKIQVKKFTL